MASVSPMNNIGIAPKGNLIERKHVPVTALLTVIIVVVLSLSINLWIVPIATEEPPPTGDEFFDLFFGGIDEVGSVNEGAINESKMNKTKVNGTETDGHKTETKKPVMDMSVGIVNKMMKEKKTNCLYRGEFSRDRKGSNFGHWGEGVICVTKTHVGFMGSLAYGPDYYLYYATEYVETRGDFYRIKAASFKGHRIKSFSGFIFEIPPSVVIANYPALVVWCERFGVYITSTKLTKV